jgi:RNA ligase (TIGR02306 family)
MRKLASIRKIEKILPIDGADNIELACIGGWKCVVKKGEFREGDLCVYFEIDSFLPEDPRFEFLRKSCFKEVNGERGFRIRTIKFRGQISQGLALPISIFPEIKDFKEGDDVTEILRVKKYEPPIPVTLTGDIYGDFPTHLFPKTDQERAENLVDEILKNKDLDYEVTRKMDGTSCTIYKHNGHFGVCSRNYELKNSEKKPVYWVIAERYKFEETLSDGYAIQGEVVGRNIQNNSEGLKDIDLFIFDVYDIKENRYLTPEERYKFVKDISAKHVPVVHESFVLSRDLNLGEDLISELRKVANSQKTFCGKVAEGVVFKSTSKNRFSFKVINPEYLLREEK